jgi:hypothetical protein
MVKTVGGDSYISAFVDEMTKGVVGGMEQTAGGKKMLKLKGKRGGSIELAPLLVSLMTLGMRVASDPKLSETYKKHTKMSGGADILANEYDTNMTISGGSASGIYDMFANALNTVSIVGGRHTQKMKKMAHGGNKTEPVGFDNCRYDVYEQPPAVTATAAKGGKQRRQSKRNMKIHGGEGEEMPDVELPADDMISSDVMESDDVEIDQPDEIPTDLDSTDFPTDDATTGGARKYSRKASVKKTAKKALRGGEGTSISEMFSTMDTQTAGRRKSKKALRGGECNKEIEAQVAAPVAAPVEQTAGKRRARKAVRGGDGMEEMVSPINAQTAGRRKTQKAVRGGSCNDIWSNLPTLDISAGGGRKYKGKKIGGNLEAESLMPTSLKN